MTVIIIILKKIHVHFKKKKKEKEKNFGTSLVVQCLRLCSQRRGYGFDPWPGN